MERGAHAQLGEATTDGRQTRATQHRRNEMDGESSVIPSLEAFVFGNSEAVLDDKGRVLLDKTKRAFLGKDFVFLWGELGQIVAYPKARWDGMIAELATFGANNFHLQQYVRLFFSYAVTGVNADGQGRAVIPSRLRELAKLDGPLTVVGGMFRVEIWSRDEYDASQNDPEGYNRTRRESIERVYGKLRGESLPGESL